MKATFRALALSFFAGLLIGFSVGRLVTEGRSRQPIQNVVAIRWGEGKKYGKQLPYGAEVYLQAAPTPNSPSRCSVHGRVWIGRGNDYWHDLGQLDVVDDPAEATEKWGEIEWNDVGLSIGPGTPKPLVVEWKKLETHR